MKKAEPWQDIDGLLLLDKPLGLSSNHALQRARRLLRARKAGHAGTLDPLATGLLLLCFGRGTRVAENLLGRDKVYRARLRLGITTATGDAEGEILEQRDVPPLQEADLLTVLSRYTGAIEQCPPMYSALKVNGQPLYKLARKGIVVERANRTVHVHRLELISRQADELEVEVHCSKGLYVRTLAEDIGTALGCGAHLTALRRLSIGRHGLDSPLIGLEALEQMAETERASLLLPVDQALDELPVLRLDEQQAAAFCQGQRLNLGPIEGAAGTMRCYGPGGRFLGLGDLTAAGLAPVKVFV